MHTPKAKILLVDDDEELVAIWKEMLEAKEFVVETAHSGEQGLIKSRSFCPDVTVSDFNMPNGNGAFLFESLVRENILPQRFVVCSGNPFDFPPRTHGHKPYAVLAKPISFSTLLSLASIEPRSASVRWLQRRKHFRFKPDPDFKASVHFSSELDPATPNTLDCAATILDFSPFGGAGFLISAHPHIHPGIACRVQVGPFEPVRGKIVYTKDVEENCLRLGCQFLE